MDFQLTAQQAEYRELGRNFARAKLAPGYQQREAQGFVETEIRPAMGRGGLIAPELAPDLGGRGLDRLTSGDHRGGDRQPAISVRPTC
jgi:cyclohexanecarboxyl-CoA dehydrogenase